VPPISTGATAKATRTSTPEISSPCRATDSTEPFFTHQRYGQTPLSVVPRSASPSTPTGLQGCDPATAYGVRAGRTSPQSLLACAREGGRRLVYVGPGTLMLMLTVVPIVSVTRRGGRPATRYDHRGYISSFLAALLVLWLMVGTVAAAQRHYFSGSRTNCAQAVRFRLPSSRARSTLWPSAARLRSVASTTPRKGKGGGHACPCTDDVIDQIAGRMIASLTWCAVYVPTSTDICGESVASHGAPYLRFGVGSRTPTQITGRGIEASNSLTRNSMQSRRRERPSAELRHHGGVVRGRTIGDTARLPLRLISFMVCWERSRHSSKASLNGRFA